MWKQPCPFTKPGGKAISGLTCRPAASNFRDAWARLQNSMIKANRTGSYHNPLLSSLCKRLLKHLKSKYLRMRLPVHLSFRLIFVRCTLDDEICPYIHLICLIQFKYASMRQMRQIKYDELMNFASFALFPLTKRSYVRSLFKPSGQIAQISG